MKIFNPSLFLLLRERQGLSQKALSEELKVAQSEISKAEGGKKIPGEALLEKAAKLFGCTPDFFARPEVVLPDAGIRHRKRSTLSATARARIEAEAVARMLDVGVFSAALGGMRSDLPPRDGRSPEEMARALRTFWKVPAGPVEDLAGLVERHNILLLPFDFGTELLDAFAIPQPDPDAPVCIAVNTAPGFPPDRCRFTLAHELGHVVLHREEFATDADAARQEKEADRFAGEFLAPAGDIKPDLAPPPTFARLRELKRKWRMSMSSLVFRAKETGAITPAKAKGIFFLFSRYGYRRREPDLGLVRETPRAVACLAAGFAARHGPAAPDALHLTPALFAERYPGTARVPSVPGPHGGPP